MSRVLNEVACRAQGTSDLRWAGRLVRNTNPCGYAPIANSVGVICGDEIVDRAGIDADRPLEGVSLTTTAVSAAFAVLEEMSLRFSRKATFTSGSLKRRRFPSAGEIDANESR